MMTEDEHQADRRPPGVDDDTIAAVGKVSEALEYVERARGHLYSFHQLMGGADLALGQACDALRKAGHDTQADRLQTELVGRNVLYGRWTFQIVEEFDDGTSAEGAVGVVRRKRAPWRGRNGAGWSPPVV